MGELDPGTAPEGKNSVLHIGSDIHSCSQPSKVEPSVSPCVPIEERSGVCDRSFPLSDEASEFVSLGFCQPAARHSMLGLSEDCQCVFLSCSWAAALDKGLLFYCV